MKIKSLLVFAVLAIAVFCLAGFVKAQDNSALIAQLQAEIQSLMQQIAQLQGQQKPAIFVDSTPPNCYNFNNYLKIGSTGKDLDALEDALQNEGFAPPQYGNGHAGNGMSPNFDSGVVTSLKQFQAKYGIPQTGTVGPLTRAKLNSLYGCAVTNIINGICGSANNVASSTVPTNNLCSSGTARSTPYTNSSVPVLNEGQWTWYCVSNNGGTPASCEASL